MRRLVWISLLVLLNALPGCKPKQQGYIEVAASSHVVDDQVPHVSFGIQPVGKQIPTNWRYAASYTRQGKTARFGINLRISASSGASSNVRTGTGSFIAEESSESSLLLDDLRRLLKARSFPSDDVHVRELPFRFDILGENLDRGRNGNLVDAATGSWISARLYLGVHQDQELILNFQKPGGTAEFVSSDPQYGDAVLAELAKVL